MKAMPTKGTHILKRAAGLIAAVMAIIFVALPPGVSHADSTSRWQNVYDGHYLEVWNSSTQPTGRVITFPYNGSSANQLWSDYEYSNGYWSLANNNSWLWLGHVDLPVAPPAGPSACGYPDQHEWMSTPYQFWQFRWIWDSWQDRYFSMWINMAGCQGDPYHDVLSVNLNNDYNTFLYTEAFCSDQSLGDPTNCYWQR